MVCVMEMKREPPYIAFLWRFPMEWISQPPQITGSQSGARVSQVVVWSAHPCPIDRDWMPLCIAFDVDALDLSLVVVVLVVAWN